MRRILVAAARLVGAAFVQPAVAQSVQRIYLPFAPRERPVDTPVPTAAPPTATPGTSATPTQPPVPTATQPAAPTPTPTQTPGGGLTLDDLNGRSYLLAYDGTYLGVVSSNQFASDSICNQFGTYGSQFGSQSAHNPYTSTPPAIVYGGQFVGFLNKNNFLAGHLDPDYLFAYYGCT